MHLTIRDTNKTLIAELKYQFEKFDDVDIECGDIFGTECNWDGLVSPANSFGYMDGGIDRVYCDHFGWELQTAVQNLIKENCIFKELLVGQALSIKIINTDKTLIIAPTMRSPRPIETDNVFLAMRAAVHRAKHLGLKHLLCPGMGTLTGRIIPADGAQAMLFGYLAGTQA